MSAEPCTQYNIHEAKTHLSRLIERAEAGDEIVISRAGKPVVRLVALGSPPPRVRGVWRGQVVIHDDFDELPKDIASAFRGETE